MADRLYAIQELEDEVAKIPASEFDENIRLYKKLQRLNPDNERYADKVAHYERRKQEAAAAAKAAKEAADAAALAERQRKGFHCLSGWDGSHRAVKKYVEERMREPDSFEHIETRVTPVDDNGEHALIMQYRGRNAFGGMAIGVIAARIRNSDCHATIVSID